MINNRYFNIKKSGVSSTEPVIEPYIRPTDWLPLPTLIEGQQKVVGLVAILDNNLIANINLFSIRCAGAFTVNIYGLNNTLVSTTNFATGIQGQFNLNYNDFPGTESTKGYRQAIFEIVPQAGQNLTSVRLEERHALGGAQIYTTNWLDIKVVGSLISTLALRGASALTATRMLEQFEYVGVSAITSTGSNLFNECYALKNVVGKDWLNSCTSMLGMFGNCTSLQTVPFFNTQNVINMNTMFNNCTALVSVPLFNTQNVTNMSSMFASCNTLQTVPLFNTQNVTNMNNMFQSCTALVSVPLFNTQNVTNMSGMFQSCNTLQTVPLFNTQNVINMSTMFSNAQSLQTVPLFNTEKVTNMRDMFATCRSLKAIPLFNTSLVTDMGAMFTAILVNCVTLKSIPALNMSSITVAANQPGFNTLSSLSKASIFPIKFTVSFANGFLGKEELVEIFNNLITTTGQTITITGNRGASLLTAADRAIATGKGWTISG
jgi:surface protein